MHLKLLQLIQQLLKDIIIALFDKKGMAYAIPFFVIWEKVQLGTFIEND